MKSFVTILSAVLIYGFFHSLLASMWVKRRFRLWFGPETERWYRLAYNALAVVSLVPILVMTAILPDRTIYAIPSPWALIPLSIQGLAGIAAIVGLWQTGLLSFFGLQQFLHPPNSSPPVMVVSGLYRWVRHPLYTAGLVFIWLTPVMTLNILAMNLGLTLYLVVGALFEERKLLAEYGAAYREYMQRIPMLVPHFNARQPGKDQEERPTFHDNTFN
jgi:protein-S-isoprenylcysteine O-methyltransferase Ste14